jgi:hypothetical protein
METNNATCSSTIEQENTSTIGAPVLATGDFNPNLANGIYYLPASATTALGSSLIASKIGSSSSTSISCTSGTKGAIQTSLNHSLSPLKNLRPTLSNDNSLSNCSHYQQMSQVYEYSDENQLTTNGYSSDSSKIRNSSTYSSYKLIKNSQSPLMPSANRTVIDQPIVYSPSNNTSTISSKQNQSLLQPMSVIENKITNSENERSSLNNINSIQNIQNRLGNLELVSKNKFSHNEYVLSDYTPLNTAASTTVNQNNQDGSLCNIINSHK